MYFFSDIFVLIVFVLWQQSINTFVLHMQILCPMHFLNLLLHNNMMYIKIQEVTKITVYHRSFSFVFCTVCSTDKIWSQPSCIYTQIFSPKKTGFSPIRDTLQFFFTFVYLDYMQLFSVDPKIFSKFF